MATQAKTPQQEALERVLERGRKDTARARELLGDPREGFDRFIRENYDYESLLEMYRFLMEGETESDDGDMLDAR
jgi:hypothetical protein